MSYSANRRIVLDAAAPLEHRASHARSCALHVANKLGVKRSVVLEHVAARTGIDLNSPPSGEALATAFASIEAIGSAEQMLSNQSAL